MKENWLRIKKFIYGSLMISVACYFTFRIISIILVLKFDFIIYARIFQLNILSVLPTFDIIFSAICFMFAFIYFNGKKRVVISFIGLLIFLVSLYMWLPFMMLTESLTNIDISSQSNHYAVNQNNVRTQKEVSRLSIKVYKQHYPLLYKLSNSGSEEFSIESDYETIELFKQKNYKYDEKTNTLRYGNMSISLEE